MLTHYIITSLVTHKIIGMMILRRLGNTQDVPTKIPLVPLIAFLLRP